MKLELELTKTEFRSLAFKLEMAAFGDRHAGERCKNPAMAANFFNRASLLDNVALTIRDAVDE